MLEFYADCLKQGDSKRFWSLYSEQYRFSPGENKGSDFKPADIADVMIRRIEPNGGEADKAYFLMGFTIAGESIFRPQGTADASGRYSYAFYFELIRTEAGWQIASITTNP